MAGTTPCRLLLRDYEEEFLAALRIRDLDDVMEQGRVLTLSEIAKPLHDFLASIGDVLPSAMDRAFSGARTRRSHAFGRDHFNRNRKEFVGLLARATQRRSLDFRNSLPCRD